MIVDTYKEYSIVDDTKESHYSEESQTVQMKFAPCWVNHEDQSITLVHKPFQCREYLSDWLFHIHLGSTGGVWGFKCGPNDYQKDPKFIGDEILLTCTSEKAEADYLREVADVLLTGEKEWFGFLIPVWAKRSSLGMMLFSLSIRAWLEVHIKGGSKEELGYFGLPAMRGIRTKSSCIIEGLSGEGKSAIWGCLSNNKEFLWDVSTYREVPAINMRTHELFSPVVFSDMAKRVLKDKEFLDKYEKSAPLVGPQLRLVLKAMTSSKIN